MYYLHHAKEESDFDFYLKIKSEPNAILWSGFTQAPDPEKLRTHFLKMINDPKVFIFYMVDERTGERLGYCRINHIEGKTCESDGVNIIEAHQGKGLGNEIHRLKILKAKELGYDLMTGYVSENNMPSRKNMENNGWKLKKGFQTRKLEAFDREDKFLYYEVEL